MKRRFTLLMMVCFSLGLSAQTQTFYDFSWTNILGDTISMSQYAGKKVMVVNCASYCVYTPQYRPLNQVDSLYGSRYDFIVIGFPCNDFANQGGTDSAIIATCNHYDVNFPIMSSVKIITGDTAPLYKWLQRGDLNGVASHHVTWNFNKFLIDRQGHWVKWYDSNVDPTDTAIVNWIVEDSASLTTGIKTPVAVNDYINLQSANPANTSITLEVSSQMTQKLSVDLYTIDGRLVSNIYNDNVSGTKQIDHNVAALPSGVYLIRAKGQTLDRTFKLVVQH